MEKKFSIPMSGDIVYRHRFAGDGNYTKSRFIRFGINFYF
jgi:hypothetical protein